MHYMYTNIHIHSYISTYLGFYYYSFKFDVHIKLISSKMRRSSEKKISNERILHAVPEDFHFKLKTLYLNSMHLVHRVFLRNNTLRV